MNEPLHPNRGPQLGATKTSVKCSLLAFLHLAHAPDNVFFETVPTVQPVGDSDTRITSPNSRQSARPGEPFNTHRPTIRAAV